VVPDFTVSHLEIINTVLINVVVYLKEVNLEKNYLQILILFLKVIFHGIKE